MDANKGIPIYKIEDLEDKETKNFTRILKPIPSGMEKTEEKELHFVKAISDKEVIPTPNVQVSADYDEIYTDSYTRPDRFINFDYNLDTPPNYDIDSEDEQFLNSMPALKMSLTKFETMIDLFENNSLHKVVTLEEAKLYFPNNEVELLTIYEYWLHRRLKKKSALISSIPNECNNNRNGYVAFRRRKGRVRTRRYRKNDEMAFVKMLKLKRDLETVKAMLNLVNVRENHKKEKVDILSKIFTNRYTLEDFNGQIVRDVEPDTRSIKKRKYEKRINLIDVPKNKFLDQGPFAFRRKFGCQYLKPTKDFFGLEFSIPDKCSEKELEKTQVDDDTVSEVEVVFVSEDEDEQVQILLNDVSIIFY